MKPTRLANQICELHYPQHDIVSKLVSQQKSQGVAEAGLTQYDTVVEGGKGWLQLLHAQNRQETGNG